MIVRCQPGFENLLEKELEVLGLPPSGRGAGWVQAPEPTGSAGLPELCFAQMVLLAPVEITGDSVNALAARIAEYFLDSARGERFESAWPCCFEAAAGLDGLGRRTAGVEGAFHDILKKRFGRVARLATTEAPRGAGPARGLMVFFVDFKRAFVTRAVVFGGQRRMADDPLAPSRSYLKVEEAYVILGYEPTAGETVVDLGAAPGGWSYSAAKRGAKTIAIDNGPLKGGALDHPLIEHRREDAFRFEPAAGERFDWLFCDLVEEPHHVMHDLITRWLECGWCRHFIVNLKFGRVDPVALLREVQAPGSVFSRKACEVHVRHLYHDREEFTIVGRVGE